MSESGSNECHSNSNGSAVSGSVRAEYDDDSSQSLLQSIVRAFSAFTGRNPTAMEPLQSSIDPEALETLVDSANVDSCKVSFTHEDCLVTVESGGDIVIESNT